jgi:hypothetical protein
MIQWTHTPTSTKILPRAVIQHRLRRLQGDNTPPTMQESQDAARVLAEPWEGPDDLVRDEAKRIFARSAVTRLEWSTRTSSSEG